MRDTRAYVRQQEEEEEQQNQEQTAREAQEEADREVQETQEIEDKKKLRKETEEAEEATRLYKHQMASLPSREDFFTLLPVLGTSDLPDHEFGHCRLCHRPYFTSAVHGIPVEPATKTPCD